MDSAVDPTVLERLLLREVNRVRDVYGQRALVHHDNLTAAARSHSRSMAAHRYFDHYNRRGQSPAARVRSHGLACTAGENLYFTLSYTSYQRAHTGRAMTVSFDWKTEAALAHETVKHWLESPPHRATLLHTAYSRQGIGVAFSDDYRVYVTQNLCP